MSKKTTQYSQHYIAGIDEAGRGPLAGPVAVGLVVVHSENRAHVERCLRGIRDSKKISALQREEWVCVAKRLRKEGCIEYTVSLVGPSFVDAQGIVSSVRAGIVRSLKRLAHPSHRTHVLLDGGLRAPDYYLSQETIIRGDSKEPLISLAAILAKVRRDHYMENISHRYPKYGFEQHKGYGTVEHRKQIQRHGICDIHRKSFIHLL